MAFHVKATEHNLTLMLFNTCYFAKCNIVFSPSSNLSVFGSERSIVDNNK